MAKRVNGNKEAAKKLNAIVSYVITKNKKPAKTWSKCVIRSCMISYCLKYLFSIVFSKLSDYVYY